MAANQAGSVNGVAAIVPSSRLNRPAQGAAETAMPGEYYAGLAGAKNSALTTALSDPAALMTWMLT